MGTIPTTTDLNKRADAAQNKLEALKAAYDNFIKQWDKIEKEENALVKQAHEHLDANKMQAILSKIHSSKT